MIELLLIVLIPAAAAIYAWRKQQKKKCMICSVLAAGSILFLVYMNYLMAL